MATVSVRDASAPTISAISNNFTVTAGSGVTLTGITLSNATVIAGAVAGALIGIISVQTTGGLFVGSLALGGTDQAKFVIVGNQLQTTVALASGTDSITITATMSGASGSPLTRGPFTIAVLSSSNLNVTLSQPTGRTLSKYAFGFATGAVADNSFAALNTPAVVSSLAAIKPTLLRINADQQIASKFGSTPTIMDTWWSNAPQFMDPSYRLVVGVGPPVNDTSLTPTQWANATVAFATAMRNQGHEITYWEVGNEGSLDTATYASYFNAIADALHTLNGAYQVGGPVGSWWNDHDLVAFANSLGGSRCDFVVFHSYFVDRTDSTTTAYSKALAGLGISDARTALAPTILANVPLFLGEWNLNGSQDPVTLLWGIPSQATYVGAVYVALGLDRSFRDDTGFSAALWDAVYNDYYGAVGNIAFNGDPTKITLQGYYLGYAGQNVAGAELTSSTTLANFRCFVTSPTTTTFAVHMVNYDQSAAATANITMAGGAPSGPITRWEAGKSNPTTPSITTQASLVGINIPSEQIVILTGSFATSSQSGNASTGPAASGSFVNIDFTNLISPDGVPNAVVYPELFGVSTGGLTNNNYSALGNATLMSLIRALNIPLFRINSADGSNYSALWSKLLTFLPSTCRMVIGINNAANAQTIASGWKNNAQIPCTLWEYLNESGLSAASYNSGFAQMVSGIRLVDTSYQGAGNQNAGLDAAGLSSLVSANSATTLGLLDWHSYLYCQGLDATPSNSEVCLGRMAGATTARQSNEMTTAQNAVKNSYGASLPMLLGEYNIECGAGSDLRAGTSIGAASLATMTLGRASVSKQPAWGAIWDIYDDAGAWYNLIDTSNRPYPQYYMLQRLIAKMPGAMVNSSLGANGSGLAAWATQSGSNLGLTIVNSTSSPKSGQVALSHWPVNTTGNGTATLWSYPTTSLTTPIANTPGTTTTVTITAGLTSSITVPAFSAVVLSDPTGQALGNVPLALYAGVPGDAASGNYPGFDAQWDGFTSTMGRPATLCLSYMNSDRSPTDGVFGWAAQASFYSGQLHGNTRTVNTIPIISWPFGYNSGSGNTDVAAAIAAGTHDALIQTCLGSWKTNGYSALYIRPAWEFNLPNEWAVPTVTTLANFLAAFQHLYSVVHTYAASNGMTIKVIWNPNVGNNQNSSPLTVTQQYPGDAFVDVLGIDTYGSPVDGGHSPTATTSDPTQYFVSTMFNMSAASGKPVAFCEVGGRDTTFATQMGTALNSRPSGAKLEFFSMWDIDDASGNLSWTNTVDSQTTLANIWKGLMGSGGTVTAP